MSKKVLTNSLIYAFGDILNKSVPFLMLPILTKYLTPSDYGIIASFTSLVGFLAIFIGLSLQSAINVSFFKLKKERLRIYIFNALVILIGSSCIIFVLVLIFQSTISSSLLLEKEWIYIAVLIAVSQFITLLNTTLWIAEQNPRAYSMYQLSQTILISSLSILLVVGFHLGWEGHVIAMIIGYISFAMLSIVFLQKRGYFTLVYSKDDMRNLLQFGIPMIPHQLATWIRTSGDRILLILMVGSTATGLFSVGYQVAMMMTILTSAFNRAWNPYMYRLLNEENNLNNKIRIVKFTYLYFILISILSVILYFVSKLIFKYLLDESFSASIEFIVYLLLANTFNGMYFMVSGYLFYTTNTKKLAKITFSISLLHISLSYLFIALYGAIGVAYSGAISMFLIFIGVWYSSNDVYKMPWLYWKNNV